MPLHLSFMTEDDIPAFGAVDAAAMAGWGLARAQQNLITTGGTRQQEVENWTRHGLIDSEQVWVKVTDTETGALVSVAMWRFHPDGDKPKPPPKGDLTALMMAKREMETQFKGEFIGSKPYANLSILVTDPKHQRRGAGTMLVQWGCDKADDLGLMSVLTSTQAGLTLYLKYGFEVVWESDIDLRPFGVDETETRKYMIRQPAPKKA